WALLPWSCCLVTFAFRRWLFVLPARSASKDRSRWGCGLVRQAAPRKEPSMKCLVTGAAGFIGSHLCEQLLQNNHTVVGLDAFIPYYPRASKEANLARFRSHPVFSFHPLDLRCDPLDAALLGVEAIFHLAAMPGLTRSWTDFEVYESCNLL